MLGLVLRLPRAQTLGQVGPERIQAGVGHLEDPTDVRRALLVEEERRFGRVAVARVRAIAVSLQATERDQRVGEVGDGTLVKAQRVGDLRARHLSVAELREQLKLDRRQQGLRAPEAHADLHDVCGLQLRGHPLPPVVVVVSGRAAAGL